MSEDDIKAPEPYFHLGEHFSSAIFGKTPDSATGTRNPAEDQKLISNFIALLADPAQRAQRTEVLSILRNARAHQFLVDVIGMKQYNARQKELVMACWESGLDFSEHLGFFADLFTNCEYPVAIEVISVIDEMKNLIDNPDLEKAIRMLGAATLPPEKQALAQETVNHLRHSGGKDR